MKAHSGKGRLTRQPSSSPAGSADKYGKDCTLSLFRYHMLPGRRRQQGHGDYDALVKGQGGVNIWDEEW